MFFRNTNRDNEMWEPLQVLASRMKNWPIHRDLTVCNSSVASLKRRYIYPFNRECPLEI